VGIKVETLASIRAANAEPNGAALGCVYFQQLVNRILNYLLDRVSSAESSEAPIQCTHYMTPQTSAEGLVLPRTQRSDLVPKATAMNRPTAQQT